MRRELGKCLFIELILWIYSVVIVDLFGKGLIIEFIYCYSNDWMIYDYLCIIYYSYFLFIYIQERFNIFFIYLNNVSWMVVYYYIIYNMSIYVKISKDWFIFYILEKNGIKEF